MTPPNGTGTTTALHLQLTYCHFQSSGQNNEKSSG
ncbi:MAG: hypothetical protein ACI9FJ_001549, partial [Alteromonadaceae bacterium]